MKLDDFEPAAEAILPKGVFDYIAGGAEDEATLRGNRQAFARYQFRFKILASADQPDLTSEVLGQRFRMPVHLAPTAIQRMAHPDGEAAAYQGRRVALSIMNSRVPITGTLVDLTQDGLLIDQDGGGQVAVSYSRLSGIDAA